MKKFFKKTIYTVGFLMLSTSNIAFAGVSAYSGTSGEKVFIESTEKETAYVKIEGLKSAWAGQVFKVKKQSASSGDRYSFDYEIELSSGKVKKSYTPIVFNGETLVKGTIVKKMILYVPGGEKNGTSLNWDEDLTKSSQKIDLQGAFKAKPFSPEVD